MVNEKDWIVEIAKRVRKHNVDIEGFYMELVDKGKAEVIELPEDPSERERVIREALSKQQE